MEWLVVIVLSFIPIVLCEIEKKTKLTYTKTLCVGITANIQSFCNI